MDARPSLRTYADQLGMGLWERLLRRPMYEVQTESRERPENVKEQIVRE